MFSVVFVCLFTGGSLSHDASHDALGPKTFPSPGRDIDPHSRRNNKDKIGWEGPTDLFNITLLILFRDKLVAHREFYILLSVTWNSSMKDIVECYVFKINNRKSIKQNLPHPSGNDEHNNGH